jgi:phosphate-selective porin OprO/OprP
VEARRRGTRTAAALAAFALVLGVEARAADPDEPESAVASQWRVHWDDGLYYRFVQSFEIPDGPILSHIEDRLGLAGKINLRVEGDGAIYGGDTKALGLDNGAEMRRFHIGTSGELFLITHAWYSVTVEFPNSGVELGDTYLEWRGRPWVGTITVGNFSPQFSLEATTSSRDITFMEQAAPIDAFAPNRAFGVQIGRPFAEDRFTWWLGAFTGSALGDSDVGDASRDLGRLAGRFTWLARTNPEAEEFLHLGLSGTFVFTNGDARFQSRPESHIAPRVIDTDDIDSHRTSSVALEFAWVRGPWSVQSELVQSSVSATDEGALRFGGFYVYTSYFLTGESRPYDPTAGAFAQLVPRRPFSLQTGGRGAFEVGARYSRTDLNDNAVDGGFLGEINVGLNWYLTRHVATRFELGYAKVRGRRDMDTQFFRFAQMRVALNW